MPPQKARLHHKTGKLKNINKSYTTQQSASSSSADPTSSITVRSNGSANRPSTATNTSATQTEILPSSSRSTTVPVAVASAPSSGHDTEVDQQFELELCWCIQTMEKSLDSGSLSAKQASDTEKTIKLLKSHNQPAIRKRQIMRTAFGDYRSKMVEEEKKLRLGSRQIQFVEPHSEKETAKLKSHFVKKSLAATLGEKDFKFCFPVPDIDKLNLEDSPAGTNNDSNVASAQNMGPSEEKPTNLPPKATVNSIFVPSDNSFKFNFSS